MAKVIASPQFAQVWDAGQPGRPQRGGAAAVRRTPLGCALGVQGDSVNLSLGPIIEQVKSGARRARLHAGFVDPDREQVVRAHAVQLGDEGAGGLRLPRPEIGLWLPLLSLVLLVGGILLARDKRAAVFRSGLGLAGSMLLLGVALAIGRTVYVDTTPANVLDSGDRRAGLRHPDPVPADRAAGRGRWWGW